MRFDLHVHSTASDGTLDAPQLVTMALELGLSALAIADHDSVEALPAALESAAETQLTLIPAVELSAMYEDRDVHILGYFIDHTDETLLAVLSALREARLERARAIIDALDAEGYDLTLDEVLEIAQGGSIGRSHLARALVSRGHAADIREAFERYLGRGRPFYIPKPVTSPAAVVATVRAAGGLPVLAHPGITCANDLVLPLVPLGLAGIEAYHAEHTPEQMSHYDRIASELGILITGGSDYHGPDAGGAAMGSVSMPDGTLEALLAASH